MNIQTFNNAILYEAKLKALSIDELRRLVVQFPYFQTARILLLKKIKEEEPQDFDQELKKSAVCIGDRAKLYLYLNAFGIEAKFQDLPELSLITTAGERDESVTASYGSDTDTTFNYLFVSEEEAVEINQRDVLKTVEEMGCLGEEKQDEDWMLIDHFVNLGNAKIKPTDQSLVPQGNLAKDSAVNNNTVLTETLAKIYVSQKKYDQAMNIFRGLSLKFPDKNAYFAARIQELSILLKNN